MAQQQIQRKTSSTEPEPEMEVDTIPGTGEFDNSIDTLLEEIDLVLEPHAQDFVRSYVQEGGE